MVLDFRGTRRRIADAWIRTIIPQKVEDADKYFGEEEKTTDEREESNVGLVVVAALVIVLILCLSCILKSVDVEPGF